MFYRRAMFAFAVACALVAVGCSRTAPRQPRVPIVSIQLDPATPVVPLGADALVTAQGIKADGSTVELDDVEWSTSDGEVLALTPQRSTVRIRGLAVGQAELTATARGIGATVRVTVEQPAPVRLELTPPEATVAVGGTLQLSAVAIMSDDSSADVTTRADWSVTDSTVAGVGNEDSNKGQVRGSAQGETEITAAFGGLTASARITVSGAELLRVDVTPSRATLPLNSRQPFTAVAVFSDATTSDVTEHADWSSSDPTVIRFTAASGPGVAEAIGAGTVLVTARYGGLEGLAEATVTTEQLQALEIAPARVQLARGTSSQLQATAIFENGSRADVTFQANWQSADPTVAEASLTVPGAVKGLNPGRTLVSAEFLGMTASAQIEVTNATLDLLVITPSAVTVPKGASTRLVATGTYSDGTTQDVTALALWSSSDPQVAAVSNVPATRGEVQARAVGGVGITATLEGQVAHATVTVSPATVTSLEITPAAPSVAKGTTQQLQAVATFSDGSTLDVTEQAAWSSSDNAIASVTTVGVSGRGLLSGVSPGQAEITATWSGAIGKASATVTPATLLSLSIAPLNPSTPKGTDLQMQAEASFSDGTVQDVTRLVTWSSLDSTIAAISNATGSNGLVTALMTGSTELAATLSGTTVRTRLTVTPAVLLTFRVSPAQMTLEYQGSLQASATATYSDGSVVDVTDQASWVSADPLIATVTSGGTGRGRVDAGRPGTTTVTASFGGRSGAIAVTVNAPKLTAVEVRPATVSVPAGLDTQLRAFGIFADGSEQDVTSSAAWSSSSAHATVSNGSTGGKVRGLTPGAATITAAFGGFSGTAEVTVTSALPESLTISPTTVTLAAGLEQAFTVRAFFTDGSSQEVTAQASFTSADTSIVGMNQNTARGIREGGPVTITARFNELSATARVTVGPPILVSLALSSNGLALVKGQESELRAIATYSDGSTRDVTDQSAWTSSNVAVASVVNGLVRGVGGGSATIRATFQGKNASASVIVEEPVLQKVVLSPPNAVLRPNLIYPFKSFALYSDGTTREVTTAALWTSSNPTVAQPTNSGGYLGVWARGLGTAQVRSTIDGVLGETNINVASATLNEAQVSPAQAQLPVGVALKLSGVYAYSDGWAVEIQNPQWSSSNPSVASIDPNGVVKAIRQGTATITLTAFSSGGGTFTARSTITVTPATLVSIDLEAPSTMVVGLASRVRAIGNFSDGTRVDLGPSVIWSSSDSTMATIVPDVEGAKVTALRPGSVTLRASLAGKQGTAPVTLSTATLESLQLSVAQSTLPLGSTSPVTVMGSFSDGTQLDLTDSVTFDPRDPSIALVGYGVYTNARRQYVIAQSPGTTAIRASLNGVTASADVTVSGAALRSIQLAVGNDPPSATLTVPSNQKSQLRAIGTFSDGTTADVTVMCTFQPARSGPGVVATISNTWAGEVNPISAGTQTVTVTYAPAYIGQSTVTGTAQLVVQ